jgi:hypothetical protein
MIDIANPRSAKPLMTLTRRTFKNINKDHEAAIKFYLPEELTNPNYLQWTVFWNQVYYGGECEFDAASIASFEAMGVVVVE